MAPEWCRDPKGRGAGVPGSCYFSGGIGRTLGEHLRCRNIPGQGLGCGEHGQIDQALDQEMTIHIRPAKADDSAMFARGRNLTIQIAQIRQPQPTTPAPKPVPTGFRWT